MFISKTKDNKRVHISKASKEELYYCPICGSELQIRDGKINIKHFAHKKGSECSSLDGWHYDMSEWHYEWQNQFPIDTQEVVFKNNNKIHRADVFINNTVLEFQHSPISQDEFNDRNNFYNNLGYKVIWIFDVADKDFYFFNKKDYEDIIFRWNHPLRFLKTINNNKMLHIFLQVDRPIWFSQKDYKAIEDINNIDIKNNIIKFSEYDEENNLFTSDNYYSDYEIVNAYTHFHELFKYNYKKKPNVHLLTDEVYLNDHNYCFSYDFDFYGYCPANKKELYSHKECVDCNYIDTMCTRCMYRFKDLPLDKISKINYVKYDDEGKVVSYNIEIDGKEKIVNMEALPKFKNNLLYYAQKISDAKVARFVNTVTGKRIQMSNYNINRLIKYKKCFAKLCDYSNASPNEYEIYNWDKDQWILQWYANDYSH